MRDTLPTIPIISRHCDSAIINILFDNPMTIHHDRAVQLLFIISSPNPNPRTAGYIFVHYFIFEKKMKNLKGTFQSSVTKCFFGEKC